MHCIYLAGYRGIDIGYDNPLKWVYESADLDYLFVDRDGLSRF